MDPVSADAVRVPDRALVQTDSSRTRETPEALVCSSHTTQSVNVAEAVGAPACAPACAGTGTGKVGVPGFDLTADAPVNVGGVHYFACPHCGVSISVEVVACGIFRCGVVKRTGKPVPPHADRATCERLAREDGVWGCAKPFKFDGQRAAPCDYV